MSKRNCLAPYLERFFTEHLSAERGVSPNTLRSYGLAFALFLDFMRERLHVMAERLTLTHFNRKNVLGYVDWIENERGDSVATRNLRLAAMRSFSRYMQYERAEMLQQWQDILAIKAKNAINGTMNHLSLDGVKALLEQVRTDTAPGRRDLAMLSLLYETGARAQELVDLRPMDVNLSRPCHVVLHGKGKKKRIVPVQDPVARTLRTYMEENGLLDPEMNHRALFQNRSRGKMTTGGVAYVLRNYAAMARVAHKDLIPERISPHCLRHSKAMHLLQAGVNLVYIRDILGHSSIQTTEIYARADSKQKREALEKAYSPVLPAVGTGVAPRDGQAGVASWERDPGLKEWLKGLGRGPE